MKLQPFFTACEQSKTKYSQSTKKMNYFVPVTEETGDVLVITVLLVQALPLLIVPAVWELGDIVHLSIMICQEQSCSVKTSQVNQSWPFETSPDLSKPVMISQNQSCSVKTSHDLSKPIVTWKNLPNSMSSSTSLSFLLSTSLWNHFTMNNYIDIAHVSVLGKEESWKRLVPHPASGEYQTQ